MGSQRVATGELTARRNALGDPGREANINDGNEGAAAAARPPSRRAVR
jgi:hypothetical protein